MAPRSARTLACADNAGQGLSAAGTAIVLSMCGRYSVAVSGTALFDVLELDGIETGFEWSPDRRDASLIEAVTRGGGDR